MFDSVLRPQFARRFDGLASLLHRGGLTANQLTLGGLVIGAAGCVAVAFGAWWVGLGLWILNRIFDGLDGLVARRTSTSDLGGFLDITADFAIYGGMVVAIGIHVPDARVSALVLFLTYYLSGSSFLAWSSLAARRMHDGDERSLHFPAGIAEGTETIAAYVVILALPAYTVPLMWTWAGLVGVTVIQRLVFVARQLRDQ